MALRLESAAGELVKRYNDRYPRKVFDWNEEICKEVWTGRNGKVETTIFDLTLSTYAFFVANQAGRPGASIARADLKASLSLSLARCFNRV